MMSEKKNVEEPCCKLAEQYGYQHFKFDRPGGKKGWPDRAFWGPEGRQFLVEFKRPGKQLSRLQRYWGSKFLMLGHEHHVVRSVEEFRAVLEA